jgi:hypothetical protein
VLFINDINVTGTQQLYVQRTMESVHPASIHWLYVIQVEPALGRSNPEIEYELNHLKHETFEDFGEIVARTNIDYTSRCVERLLRYPVERLKPLLRSLDPARHKGCRADLGRAYGRARHDQSCVACEPGSSGKIAASLTATPSLSNSIFQSR